MKSLSDRCDNESVGLDVREAGRSDEVLGVAADLRRADGSEVEAVFALVMVLGVRDGE